MEKPKFDIEYHSCDLKTLVELKEAGITEFIAEVAINEYWCLFYGGRKISEKVIKCQHEPAGFYFRGDPPDESELFSNTTCRITFQVDRFKKHYP